MNAGRTGQRMHTISSAICVRAGAARIMDLAIPF